MAIDLTKFIGKQMTVKKPSIDISKFISVPKITPQITSKTEIKREIITPTIQTKTLKSGGQYLSDGTGKLIKEERDYGTLPTKKGEERDHIIPVSLGGTSNDPNLQYLKSDKTFLEKVLDKPASTKNRQEGKMLVEWAAIKDYNEGKIGLNEARNRVLNWNNQPESAYKFFASSFLDTAKKTTTGLFGDMLRVVLPRSLKQKLGLTSATPKNALVAPITEETKTKLVKQAKKEEKEYGFGISKPKELIKGVARGTETFIGDTIGNLLNWYGENLKQKPKEKIPTSATEYLKNVIMKTPIAQRFKYEVGDVIQNTGNKLRIYLSEASKQGWETEHPYLEDKGIFSDKRNVKIFAALGENIPSLGVAAGATAMTGNPYVGAGILGLSQGADTYRNLREKGASIEKANLFGALDAIGSTVLEKLPLDSVLKGKIGMSMVKEGTQEGVQQVWSNLANIWGGDNTRKYFDGAAESFVLGAASGGAVSAFSRGLSAIKMKTLEAQAKQAGVSDKQLDLIKQQIAGVVSENSDKIEPILQEQLAKPLDKTNVAILNKITEDTRKAQPKQNKLKLDKLVSQTKPILEEKNKEKQLKEAKKYKNSQEMLKAQPRLKWELEMKDGTKKIISTDNNFKEETIKKLYKPKAIINQTKLEIDNIWNEANTKISTEKKRKLGIQKPPKQKTEVRESQAYKKYKEQFDIELPDTPEYEKVKLAEDRARAFDFVQQDREQAIRIAKGLDLPPEGILQNNIDREIIESEIAKPKKERDNKLIATVAKRQSLRLTRAGEEISSQQGAYSDNDYNFFIKKILEQRTQQALKIDYRKDKTQRKKKFTEQISEKAKELKKEIDRRAAKIKSAEDIINSIIC